MAAKNLFAKVLSKSSLFAATKSTRQLLYPLCISARRQICIQTVLSIAKPYHEPKLLSWIPEAKRHYSSESASTALQQRLLDCLKQFDKLSEKSKEIKLDSRFKEDLQMDSLDHVEMIMLVEDEFGLEIPEAQLEHLDTPAKIAEYLHKSEINKSNP